MFVPRPDYAGYRCYHNYTITPFSMKESGCFYESQMGVLKKGLSETIAIVMVIKE